MQDRIFLLAAAAAFFLFLVYWQRSGKVDPARARALVEQGARLVDVRSPGEFSGGHLPGAINIPVGEVRARHGELGDRTRPVIVYCASGRRSASATNTLKGLGFSEVHDLGAMARWNR
jgi:phage shock protein E